LTPTQVASQFFDILVQFNADPGQGLAGLSPDMQEKRKYCLYKVGYIRECIKNGQEPVPGPPGGELEQELERIMQGMYAIYLVT
jgi:hypothetical protein